jgi:predicted RNA-binding Zn-ribbon protein involved in translation (DUF1610 family)
MDSDPVANSDSGPDVAKQVCPQCGTELGDARPAKMDCPNCGQRLRPERDRSAEEAALDEALAESFPASDPPAFP